MESDNNREFDRHFKAKLSKLEAEVPASLWNNIARELPPQENVRKMPSGGRIPYTWAAVAASLLIGFTVWKLQPEEVVHLRSATVVAEVAAKSAVGKEENTAPAPVKDELPSAAYANSAKGLPVAPPEEATPARRSKTSQSDYAFAEPVQPPAIRQPERITITEPENTLEAEVYSPAEEEVAFAPEASEDMPATELPDPDPSPLTPQERSRPKVVSSVLNFIASNIQIGDGGTRIEFYENEHGLLKVDVKGFLTKNNQGL